jgi:hypothetical protein
VLVLNRALLLRVKLVHAVVQEDVDSRAIRGIRDTADEDIMVGFVMLDRREQQRR